jgi:hypothetical protein
LTWNSIAALTIKGNGYTRINGTNYIAKNKAGVFCTPYNYRDVFIRIPRTKQVFITGSSFDFIRRSFHISVIKQSITAHPSAGY